jgi:peptidoglycan/LPS O-acetylase OafA/YrhL
LKKEKIFFPNLDGLRFFSFLIVFLSHILFTKNDHIKEESWFRFFKGRIFYEGDLGVSFFFVLSGFLITYLLVKEKEFTGNVHISSFYIRRALRIWPLYYFCVFFGFVIFPLLKTAFGQTPNETADPILCSIFLNNFNHVFNGLPDASVLSVLWSVAIEEQFYLLWPILFYIIPSRFYIYIFITIIIASISFRAVYVNREIDLLTLGVISDMAIGGLGAYLTIANMKFLKKLERSNKLFNLIPYVVVIIFLLYRQELFSTTFLVIIKRIIISFFFAWIILEQNFCKNSLFKVSKLKVITKLGKYTYGLYCLHTIAILVVISILEKLGLNKHSWQIWLLQIPLAMFLSIVFSYFSFTYFESFFLKLKDRFAYIVKQ